MSAKIDVPFGGLPEAGRLRFGASQLEAAVFEVRFLSDRQELSNDAAQELLGGLAPLVSHLEPAMQRDVAFSMGPDGEIKPSSSVSGRGWQFSTPDRSQTFTVLPTRASIQVSRYEHWSSTMRPGIDALLGAVSGVVAPTLCQRIGLRYINRLDGDRSVWEPMLGGSLAGALRDAVLGGLVDHAQGEFRITLESDVKVLVRYGIVPGAPDGPGGFLIDLDGFVERAQPFSVDEIAVVSQRLNRTLLAVLKMLLSAEGLERMKPSSLDAPNEGDL